MILENWAILWDARFIIVSGLFVTIATFVVGFVFAFIFAIVINYYCEHSEVIRFLSVCLINIVRKLPFLLVLYMMYFGLPSIGILLEAWSAGLLAITLYNGCYIAEILRGARLVIPSGAVEAGTATGFSRLQLYRHVIFPMTLARSRIAITNQAIFTLKETAYLSMITINELTAATTLVSQTHFITLEVFALTVVLYLVIGLAVEYPFTLYGNYMYRRGLQ